MVQNYYTDADSLWINASPHIEPKQPITPQCTDRKAEVGTKVRDSWCQLAVSTPTDSSSSFSHLSFGTFGKKSGAAALRELQADAMLSRFPNCCLSTSAVHCNLVITLILGAKRSEHCYNEMSIKMKIINRSTIL